MEPKKYPLYYKMRTKDIAEECFCSIRTADRIKKCIKNLYSIDVVLYRHFLMYFKELE